MKRIITIPLTVAALSLGLAACDLEEEASGTDTIAETRSEERKPEKKGKQKGKQQTVKVAEDEGPTMTREQENALRSADDYISFSSFSKTGLIEQLEYEGYSKKDATFAVNNLQVNWKEQAAKSAEGYLEYSGFSRSGLIEQLEYEGFTREQAEYGVTQAGL